MLGFVCVGTGVVPVLGGVQVFIPVSLSVGVGLAVSVWGSGSGMCPEVPVTEVGGMHDGAGWWPSWQAGAPLFSWVQGSGEGLVFIPDVSWFWVEVLGFGVGWGAAVTCRNRAGAGQGDCASCNHVLL